jgi:hypothetical protein
MSTQEIEAVLVHDENLVTEVMKYGESEQTVCEEVQT